MLLERVYLQDGSSCLLFNPRYTHAVDGQVLVGRLVDENGQPSGDSVMISPLNIAYTVAVKRNDSYGYDDDPMSVPPSLR